MEHAFEKLFTIEEANRMLPLVRRIVEDVAATYHRLTERYFRYQQICPEDDSSLDDAHREELESVYNELYRDQQELAGYVRELQKLGVYLKGESEGLVDFPCVMDDRVVFLCWKLGEPEVLHWHELESGFRGRQPLYVSSRTE